MTVPFTFLLARAIQVYEMILVIYVLMSWIPPLTTTAVYEFLRDLSEPFLRLFRRWIPPLGMIDLTPVIAIFVLEIVRIVLLRGVRW